MEIIEREIIFPANQSFLIKETDLTKNCGIIHTHGNYELNFTVDAYGKRYVAGNVSDFIPGDLILMAPGVAHDWEIENKEINPKAYTIYFKKDFFENGLMTISELRFLHSIIKQSKHGVLIKGIDIQKFTLLFKSLVFRRSKFDSIIKALKLLKHISRNNEIQVLATAESARDVNLQHNQRIKKIYDFVFSNFQREIKLHEVASLVGLSRGAFSAFFKKSTNKTFSAFIKEVRIGYACKLLLSDTDRPVSDVCFESGYNNFANFNRQFKEVTNLSPKEFRRQSTS